MDIETSLNGSSSESEQPSRVPTFDPLPPFARRVLAFGCFSTFLFLPLLTMYLLPDSKASSDWHLALLFLLCNIICDNYILRGFPWSTGFLADIYPERPNSLAPRHLWTIYTLAFFTTSYAGIACVYFSGSGWLESHYFEILVMAYVYAIFAAYFMRPLLRPYFLQCFIAPVRYLRSMVPTIVARPRADDAQPLLDSTLPRCLRPFYWRTVPAHTDIESSLDVPDTATTRLALRPSSPGGIRLSTDGR